MQLEKLSIELNKWGDEKGHYTAEVKIADERNTLSIQLDPSASDALLPLVIDKLCASAEKYASGLRDKLLKMANTEGDKKDE